MTDIENTKSPGTENTPNPSFKKRGTSQETIFIRYDSNLVARARDLRNNQTFTAAN